jgi:hypothetical protein
MEILMNGDIYLRREPDYTEYSFSEIEEMKIEKEMIIEEIEMARKELESKILGISSLSEEAKERIFLGASGELDKKIDQINKREEKLLEKGKANFDEYKNFWTLVCNEEGLQMIEQTSNGQGKTRKYFNKKEMEEDFISLRDTLKESIYLGREFLVPEEVDGLLIFSFGANTQSSGFIATYFIGDRAIIFNKKNNRFELAVAEELLPKTMGQMPIVHDEYRDKGELYQAIFKQIVNDKDKSL